VTICAPCVHILYPGLVHPLPLLSLPSQNDFDRFQCSCSYVYRRYFNDIHPPLSSSFTFSFYYFSTLNMICFTFLSFIVFVSVHCSVGVCLGILSVNILYFNQSNSLYYSSLSFPLFCIVQQFLVHFLVLFYYTDVMYFNIIHCLSFFFFSFLSLL
jgi:hypothetical protein